MTIDFVQASAKIETSNARALKSMGVKTVAGLKAAGFDIAVPHGLTNETAAAVPGKLPDLGASVRNAIISAVPRFSAQPELSPTRQAPEAQIEEQTAVEAAIPAVPLSTGITTAEAAKMSTMQPLAAFLGILLVFIHFSNLTELAHTIVGTNLRIMYMVAPFAYAAVLFNGGIASTLRSKWAVSFLLFAVWMVMAIPFSSWIGGSIGVVWLFLMVPTPMIFVTTGLILKWSQVRAAFNAIALAGVVVAGSGVFFGQMLAGDRMFLMSSGMLGNPNDIASHLLLTIGFLSFVVMDPKRNFVLRIGAVGVIGYSLLLILQTASRGALVSLVAAVLFLLWKAPMKIRVATVAISAIAAVTVPILLSDQILDRFSTLTGAEHSEADESKESRSYLFWQSVRFTIERPVFGVGPGQFVNFEGKTAISEGLVGNWHATHCSWTQVSSECGIPAAVFLLIAIGGSMWGVMRTYDEANKRGNIEIRNACLCFLLAVVPFLVSITLLSNAYRFYLPTLIGLAIVLTRCAREQMDAESENTQPSAG